MSTAAVVPGRRPAHAGTFYPAEPEALRELVDSLLADAAVRLPPIRPDTVLGVLVPHAGLAFSGAVAAAGWAVVGSARPTTIVLIGGDHDGRAWGASVWTDGPWSGPLGNGLIDHRLAERLVALGPPFVADNAVHYDEHSLEVQMPFVARACPGARVVPLLVGERRSGVAETAGTWLGRIVGGLRADGERVVLVASSDLAHYPPASVAPDIARQVLGPILRLGGPDLLRVEEEIRASDEPGVSCGLCGLGAVRCLLAAVEGAGATHGRMLAEATSADREPAAAGRTVGYAAVAFEC